MYRDGEEQPLRVALQRRAWGSWWMKTEREPAVCSCSSESKWYPGLLGSQLFTRVDNGRTSGIGLKWKEGRFRLAIREKFFTERVVRCWNRLPRELVDAPSLGVFRAGLDGALGSLV